MAIIKRFERAELKRRTAHKTSVVCKYGSVGIEPGKLIQLNTYGSDEREFPGKLSQTLQLDRGAAEQLVSILKHEFDL